MVWSDPEARESRWRARGSRSPCLSPNHSRETVARVQPSSGRGSPWRRSRRPRSRARARRRRRSPASGRGGPAAACGRRRGRAPGAGAGAATARRMARKLAWRMFIVVISATLAWPMPMRAQASSSSEERLAAERGQALAVVEAVGDRQRIEDHRGGDDRPGPGPAADLVDAADRRRSRDLDAEVGKAPAVLRHAPRLPRQVAAACLGARGRAGKRRRRASGALVAGRRGAQADEIVDVDVLARRRRRGHAADDLAVLADEGAGRERAHRDLVPERQRRRGAQRGVAADELDRPRRRRPPRRGRRRRRPGSRRIARLTPRPTPPRGGGR